MYKIQTLNKISPLGLKLFPKDTYEIAGETGTNPDAIVLRSFNMLEMAIPASVKAIARAGAGYNNIPVDACTQKGIVVFNTPGANANGVKELTLTGLFLSARKIAQGYEWHKSLVGKGEEISKIVEKEKSSFEGPELKGKTLGVIGLGAIGAMVANDAEALGMQVIGYDPFLSIEGAWFLSRTIRRATNLNTLLAEADYISLHLPQDEKTKGMFNAEKFGLMKKGVRIINMARGGLVNTKDLVKAVNDGTVASYVTDFGSEELLKSKNVICIPHLGASTPESEDNCAMMAVNQIRNYLENGNIKNSVNFPAVEMARAPASHRFVLANKNNPNTVNQISTLLSQQGITIIDMTSKQRDAITYSIIDADKKVPADIIEKMKASDGVLLVRAL